MGDDRLLVQYRDSTRRGGYRWVLLSEGPRRDRLYNWVVGRPSRFMQCMAYSYCFQPAEYCLYEITTHWEVYVECCEMHAKMLSERGREVQRE